MSPSFAALQSQVQKNQEEDKRMQRSGETLEETRARLRAEFVEHWKDKEPEVEPMQNPHDRISDLIFNMGQSDKPRTDASSPNATPMDRNTALIEQALEQMFRSKSMPTHEIVEVNPAILDAFRHSPLKEKRSIRLLHFHEDEYSFHASGGRQHICTMETFPLDEVPAYLTLSYSWEGPRNDEKSLKEYAEHRNWIIQKLEIWTSVF
ncbi:hypothetical protein DL98DRAFT_535842 [Cadophora sp. DSE1049]|nr:hypothetical protein DL98DRAFT_535842 [Cadophora sp. DSE1049]